MITFIQHASSSRGNLYEVRNQAGGRILIECGLTWAETLKCLGHDLSNIRGVFVSHEHMDHAKGINEVLSAGLDVYASAGTLEVLNLAGKRRTRSIQARDLIRLDGFQVFAFSTAHDAAEPLGFVVYADGDHLFFATDTSYIPGRFDLPFAIVAIECSYDVDLLQARVDSGQLNESLAKRLLDSHMDKNTTREYVAEKCNLSKCREIHLLHMSGDNINKDDAAEWFFEQLFIPVKYL